MAVATDRDRLGREIWAAPAAGALGRDALTATIAVDTAFEYLSVSPFAEETPRLTPTVRYRWAVLAAGTLSQTSFSALAIGLPVLVPTLREEYDLSSARSASCSGRSGSARS